MSSPFLSYAIYYNCNYRAILKNREKIVCYMYITSFREFYKKFLMNQVLITSTHEAKY